MLTVNLRSSEGSSNPSPIPHHDIMENMCPGASEILSQCLDRPHTAAPEWHSSSTVESQQVAMWAHGKLC